MTDMLAFGRQVRPVLSLVALVSVLLTWRFGLSGAIPRGPRAWSAVAALACLTGAVAVHLGAMTYWLADPWLIPAGARPCGFGEHAFDFVATAAGSLAAVGVIGVSQGRARYTAAIAGVSMMLLWWTAI